MGVWHEHSLTVAATRAACDAALSLSPSLPPFILFSLSFSLSLYLIHKQTCIRLYAVEERMRRAALAIVEHALGDRVYFARASANSVRKAAERSSVKVAGKLSWEGQTLGAHRHVLHACSHVVCCNAIDAAQP
jgi:hypothetical protein